MLNVVCVNAGNYLNRGVEYVRILNDMVRRNLPEGYPGKFIVFTDSPGDYGPEIEVRQLPVPGLDGWWNKLSLFKQGVFEAGERVLYLDLDTVLTGRLDAVADYSGDFAILRDFYRPSGLQSSVMAWRVSPKTEDIWMYWVRAQMPKVIGGDQTWIEQAYTGKPDIWQSILPDAFISYKVSGGSAPDKAAVVVFHGHPRPHEVLTGWVPAVWKEGGITRAELDAVCNTDKEKIHDNIRSACERDLVWFDFDWKHNDKQVCIVGGGPSLKDQLPILKRRQGLGQEVWALNGAANYLMDQGIIPDAQIILDAKPENAAFVSRPQRSMRYYIGSQCDPAIFDLLDGQNVTLFHCQSEGVQELLQDEVERPVHLLGAGTTVALKAMIIAELSGYRVMHLFGVDSCYFGDEHHAYRQSWNDGEPLMDLIYGERTFKCAPWMVGQAQDFIEYAQRFTGIITVAGDGLLAHIAREGIPESAVDTRAREILSRLPEGPIVGAEIGVFAGQLSERLLAARPDLTLHMIDSWGDYDPSLEESGDYHATLTKESQESYYQMTRNAVSSFGERAIIHRKKSVDAVYGVQNDLDFVFIDADHSYEGCHADIKAWSGKVRGGGLLCGHDYDNVDYPQWGVKRAVDEYVAANRLKLELGDNFTWFVKTKGY
jgi:hypothetical protein